MIVRYQSTSEDAMNVNEVLIYGLPKGETKDYMEDLLACFPDTRKTAENIERVKAAASAEGWHSFRVTTWRGEAPDFVKTVAI
jgi:hypothetical protein